MDEYKMICWESALRASISSLLLSIASIDSNIFVPLIALSFAPDSVMGLKGTLFGYGVSF